MTATTTKTDSKIDIPKWKVSGDWFDVCKCTIPCPCTFAQAPTFGDCAGVLVWHIQKGQYSKTVLDGLNILGLGGFTGNFWAGQVKDAIMGFFIEERANAQPTSLVSVDFEYGLIPYQEYFQSII